jgi:endonuclease III
MRVMSGTRPQSDDRPAARCTRLRRVVAALDAFYGRPEWSPRYPPLDELVYTVLSQNTADVNTIRSFTSLRQRFPTWPEVRDASDDEVEAAIALGGLAHTKAPRIRRILAALSERTGEPDLAELDAMSDDEAQDYLVRLPGVGLKTAACVLMFALGRPVMPVDTHVHRLARRLDLIDVRVTADQAHPLLTHMAGPKNVYAAHIHLVDHGRRVCHARRPACGDCPLTALCPSAFAA